MLLPQFTVGEYYTEILEEVHRHYGKLCNGCVPSGSISDKHVPDLYYDRN